jgi:DNA-binding NtrC family response regulator
MNAVQILAISDDLHTCNLVHTSLTSQGYEAICVASTSEAIQLLGSGVQAEFVLFDVGDDQAGARLFEPALLQLVRSDQLCILSAKEDSGSWQNFAAERRISAIFTKPLARHDLEKLLRRQDAITTSRPAAAPSMPGPGYHLEELDNNRFFLAASRMMMQLYRDIRVLAPIDIPVLILGESGVGKEIVALLLHKYHPRSKNRFLNVNCAALPTELLESELFGYEAGAFTGAMKSKPGKFELANEGTLLLDEIGEMSPQMQAKLLHVLQDGSFSRLGGRSATQVDVRILAATNIDMQTAILEKRFREDLYYRLNTLTLVIPPLRERREEIPLLIEELNRRGIASAGEPIVLSQRILDAAMEYHWPGNLRELRNFVIRTLILRDQESAYAYLQCKTQSLDTSLAVSSPADMTDKKAVSPAGMKNAISEIKNQTEIRLLQDALSASGWNRRKAATNLNISYRSLLYKIQQHGLNA